MKKLFLTSGIIACMACPAFADPTYGIAPDDVAYTANPEQGHSNNSYPAGSGATNPTDAQFSASTVDDACVLPVLSTYSGSTTLTAQWQKAYWTINFVSSLGVESPLTVTTPGTAAAPTPMYAVNGTSGIYTAIDSDDNFADANLVTANNNPFTAATDGQSPVGDTVSYNIDYNFGTINNANHTYQASELRTASADTSEVKTLAGFYKQTCTTDPQTEEETCTLGDTPMIDSSRNLTLAGASAASNATADQTWVAQWNNVTPSTPTSPVLYGYSFDGWSTSSNGSGTLGAIGADTTVYANWTADQYTVTYSCGTGDDIVGHPNLTADPNTGVYSNTATYNGNYTWLSNSDASHCGKLGYHFTGWTCTTSDLETDAAASYGTLVTNGGATQTGANTHVWNGNSVTGGWRFEHLTDGATIACVAEYAPNIVAITWKDGTTENGGNTLTGEALGANGAAASCEYDNSITLPTTPTREGWTFTGWQVVDNATPDTSVRNQQ